MSKLPDFEAMAIFAKVVELRSFAAAASELALSKATVSKAVGRLEERLGARLFNRTSRRLALTDAGRTLAVKLLRMLSESQLDALFESSGFSTFPHVLAEARNPQAWTRVFLAKVDEIASAGPCPS